MEPLLLYSSRAFPSPPKENPNPMTSHPHSHSPSPRPPLICFLSLWICLDISYKWHHIRCDLCLCSIVKETHLGVFAHEYGLQKANPIQGLFLERGRKGWLPSTKLYPGTKWELLSSPLMLPLLWPTKPGAPALGWLSQNPLGIHSRELHPGGHTGDEEVNKTWWLPLRASSPLPQPPQDTWQTDIHWHCFPWWVQAPGSLLLGVLALPPQSATGPRLPGHSSHATSSLRREGSSGITGRKGVLLSSAESLTSL